MSLISNISTLAFGLFLMIYDVRLIGGYFYLLPRIFYGVLGFGILLYSLLEIYTQLRIGEGGDCQA